MEVIDCAPVSTSDYRPDCASTVSLCSDIISPPHHVKDHFFFFMEPCLRVDPIALSRTAEDNATYL